MTRFTPECPILLNLPFCRPLRVEFLLKTDSGYPRDVEVILFNLANPESSLRFNTHWSAPQSPPLPVPGAGGPRKMSQSRVSRNSKIERRIDRPKSVVGVIRGVAQTVDVSCLLWAGSGIYGVCYLRAISYFSMSLLRVEFLLKTDSGHPKDTGVTLFTLATPIRKIHLLSSNMQF